jgi:replicative DNA helicase
MKEGALHSIEAEQSVLGCLLLDSQSFDKVADILHDDDFYQESHRIVFEHIKKLVNASQSADVVTVYDAIRSA